MVSSLAVLGSPINHSKSPQIHRAAYDVLRLNWQYGRVECSAPDLEPWLSALDDSWIGLSLTMPLKEEAFRLASSLTDIAKRSGVVNTLVREGDGWLGTNTDIAGLSLALQHHEFDLTDVVILGAGATATSAVLAVQEAGARRIRVLARRIEAAEDLSRAYGVEAELLSATMPSPEVPTSVISTLPGNIDPRETIDPKLTRAPLFDVAYDPWPSPLAEFWRSHGGTSVQGIDMLIFQALMQVRWFVHRDPERPLDREAEVLESMRAAASA